MTKITKSGEQFKVNIPSEILTLTGWSGDTEIIFVPYVTDPNQPLKKDCAILLKEIKRA